MLRTLLAFTGCLLLAACATTPDPQRFAQAIQQNDHKIIDEQLAAGLDINARLNEQNDTALMLAIKNNDWSQVQYLLKAGASPYLRNSNGLSAVDFAIQSSDVTIRNWVQEWVDNGTPQLELAEAAIKEQDVIELERLLTSETFYWYYKKHPLAVAAANINCSACIETLLKVGFDLSQGNSSDKTALMYAVYRGNLGLVKQLLQDKRALNLKDTDGWTALHLTAAKDNQSGDNIQAQIAQLLIEHGAQINAQNNHGITPLNLAVTNNKPLIVDMLLTSKADTALADNDGLTPLMTAVNNGNLNLVRRLLQDKKALNLKNTKGWTALHYTAVSTGTDRDSVQTHIAQLLIQAGADINAQTAEGNTPLNFAAITNQLPVAKTLIMANADSTLPSQDGRVALMNAVDEGHPEMVQLLATNKASLNLKNNDGWSPLHLTASSSNKGGDEVQAKIAKLLIQAGAHINIQTDSGITPLSLAALNNRALVAKVLLAAKSDAALADVEGATPLVCAVNNGHIELVRLLATNKATLNLKDKYGWTALHFTANSNNKGGDEVQAKIAQMLIQAGADINPQKNDGYTPLNLAAANNRALVAQTLLAAKADTTISDSDGWTPLMNAVNQGHIELVRLLATNKATLNQKHKDGWTALHFTANSSNKGGDALQADMAQLLIKAGAMVDSLNHELVSPLQLAAMNNFPQLVQVLLKKKASVTLQNKFNRTAEDEARKAGHWNIVAILREHAAQSGATSKPVSNNSGLFPARPAKRAGVVSCNTRCNNGDCYRTYDDGRQVRFQAQRKYNSFSGQWEFDSGSC